MTAAQILACQTCIDLATAMGAPTSPSELPAFARDLHHVVMRTLWLPHLGSNACLLAKGAPAWMRAQPTDYAHWLAIVDALQAPLGGEPFAPVFRSRVRNERQVFFLLRPLLAKTLSMAQLSAVHEQILSMQLVAVEKDFELQPVANGHRKTSGSYFTPKALVDATLSRALESLTASKILHTTICDPACGSGFFLLGAVDALIEKSRGKFEAKDIVSQCIYGVDRDVVATELCKLALCERAGLALHALKDKILTGHSLLHAPVRGQCATPEVANAFIKQTLGADHKDATSKEHRREWFHWHLRFKQVFANGGFDFVVGNPPWVAHAGRAAIALPAHERHFYLQTMPAFAGYRTTHGLFVSLGADVLKVGGTLAFVVPASMSDLAGYRAMRAAHDATNVVEKPLLDFGEGQFEGVAQPCIALVSRKTAMGRRAQDRGTPWPVARTDLDAEALALLARLSKLPPLPAHLFGERGVQTDSEVRTHLVDKPSQTDCLALREGGDIREFDAGKPTIWIDPLRLPARFRDRFDDVAILIRQTARHPIAARNDGLGFRNSLLAGFEDDQWPAGVLLCILNSRLIRWLHYQRFRDARQPILPQMKVGHLRSIPAPTALTNKLRREMKALGDKLGARNEGLTTTESEKLDRLVEQAYGVTESERAVLGG
jgi:hypothetical protein